MKYRLALDIGIASVGWAVLEHDENDNPCRIADFGVRTFEAAENPKDGSSPAVDRRAARGLRRTVRRKRARLDKMKKVLSQTLLDGAPIDFSPCDIYELRAIALDRLIENNQLARIIYSMAKHRGFKSIKKAEESGKEASKLLSAISANSDNIKNYRSIGEMFLKDAKYFEERTKTENGKIISYRVYNIRNHADDFKNTLARADVLNELKQILLSQQKLGNKKITPDFINQVIDIFSLQRSYDDGPNAPSPFLVNFKVGDCTFFPREKRAPKGSLSYEYYTMLTTINHLRINGLSLTDQQRKILIDEFLKNKEIKVEKVKKLLKLTDNDTFTGNSKCDDNKKVLLKRMFSYDAMKALGLEDNPLLHVDLLDELALIFSLYKSDDRRKMQLGKSELTKNLTYSQIDELLKLDINKFGNLSIKAIKILIPYLEAGMIYSDACAAAGLKLPEGEKSVKLKYNQLPEIQDLTSPVARRAVAQSLKVINAVIDKFGSPCAVFVELARDMSKTFEERHRIEREQKENYANNEKLKARLVNEFGILNPSGKDILRLKLYEQQKGKDIYTGKSFQDVLGLVKAIFNDNNTQIDHVLPFSRCYDDSYNNKVLVLAEENQAKGNRTPFEYFGSDEKRWMDYVERVEALFPDDKSKKGKKNPKKVRLLNTSLQEDGAELASRALNDTKYAAKLIKSLIEDHLIFQESSMKKRPVRCVNGSMTSFLRKIWGISKERFKDDTHHAVDACIVGCVGNGLLQKVTKYLQFESYKKLPDGRYVDKSTGEIVPEEIVKEFEQKNFKFPYPTFKDELNLRLSIVENPKYYQKEFEMLGYSQEEIDAVRPLHVSRSVNKKADGAIHKETVYSKKLLNPEEDKYFVTKKTPIKSLKYDKDKDEIKDFPEEYKKADPKLYQTLLQRLREFNGDAAKAFAEPIYKPSKPGNSPNQIKTVKLQAKISDWVDVRKGVAVNDSMIRIDVFEKKGKYFFVPVYVKDLYNKKLPNKICKANVSYKDWPELDETYFFKFSLYKNDLIKIKSKDGFKFTTTDKNAEKLTTTENDVFVYYNSAGRATASIKVQSINGGKESPSVGIQNLHTFEKYEIDVLGNISKAKPEKRKEFNNVIHKYPCSKSSTSVSQK